MAKANNELITDWILPAEAWRLLIERWGDPNACLGLAKKALAEGMPYRCRWVGGGAENPDLFRGRSQISWKEGWAQAVVPNSVQWGPRHWFELSRAWVLALPGKPSEQEAAIPQMLAKSPKKVRKRYRRDGVAAVVTELWPSGVPEASSTADLMKTLGDALDQRGINASPTTQRRALGRRKNP